MDLQWQPIASAPRDGTNILIRFGQDGVSQAKYVPGVPYPWKFIDTNDGVTWFINHAVDTEYGPTHWMPMPGAAIKPCAHTRLRRVRDCVVCETCSSVLTDGSWGAASLKWFRSYADAMRERHQ